MVASTRLLKALSAVLIAALAVAGCSARPGAAAIVDGRTITESQLSDATTDMAQVFGGQVSSSVVLQILVVAPSNLDVASGFGLSASADEAQQFLASVAEQEGGQAPEDLSPGALLVGRFLLVEGAVQAAPNGEEIRAEIMQRTSDLNVDLSPRYGEWTEQGPVPSTPEWIVDPATPDSA